MSERTTLIKKAVLTSVGATSNFERVKIALEDAMQDIVKVGQDLMEDLEREGKVKTENAQSFLKGLQDEASKKTEKVTIKVQDAAKDLGFVSRREYEELLERVEALELQFGEPCEGESSDASKKRGKKKAKSEVEAQNN